MLFAVPPGRYVCEEISCRFETRDVSIDAVGAGHKGSPESCPCPTCGSTMTKKYSAADLYTQLGYYNFLFDANRQAAAIKQKRETRPSPSFLYQDCHMLPGPSCRGRTRSGSG